MKNIPIPPRNTYMKTLIDKTEMMIKRMRWKAFFLAKDNNDCNNNDNNYGFKLRKCPPQNEDMDKFEADLLDTITNIKFKKFSNQFQSQLKEDIKKIKNSKKALIFADKTTNLYELDKALHEKLIHNSIAKTYKKVDTNTFDLINQEAKHLGTKLKIEGRMERMAKQEAFITLKDHKENIEHNPARRLINPAKSEMGLVSKSILKKINTSIREQTSTNQ